MAFTTLKKAKNTIALAIALGLTSAFGLSCSIHPDEPGSFTNQSYNNPTSQPDDNIPKIPFEITSMPLTSAAVDVPYEYEVDGTEPVNNIFLVEKPAGMMHEGNVIYYTPIHSGDKEVRLIAGSDLGGYSTQKFNISVAPGEFFRHMDSTYDHIQYMSSGDPDYDDLSVLLCENGYCPEVFSESYLNKKSNAISNALTKVRNIIQHDVPESKKPIEIHFTNDNSGCNIAVGDCYYYFPDGKRYDKCPDISGKNCSNLCYAGYTADSTICVPIYDRVLANLDASCLDNSADAIGNLIYPDLCRYPEFYNPPESIKSAGVCTVAHEYIHITANNKPDWIVNESLARAISYAACNDLESFCDIPLGISDYHAYIKNLCLQYNFDTDLIPGMYDYFADSTVPLTVAQDKCLTDKLVSEKNGYEINTYGYFCKSPQSCNAGAKNYYCGNEL